CRKRIPMMKSTPLFFLAMVFLHGCGSEQAQTYKAPKEPTAPPAMQEPVAQASPQPAGKGFEARLPEGWTEKPGSGMRMVSYTIEGTSIDFYLISLAMGDVPSNVNRWRGQIGLPPASPEEIEAEVETFQAGGHDLKYIEIYNEEWGTIAAIIDLAPQYWYFTAKGPAGELKANAADIRTFLESIKFEGHSH
ncbi:MAG: hypothetical protein ABFR33_11885, partial [Verrucomicrobiota bacterium]